ncbi:MAG: hypothetical protein HYY16_05600 [Planctomycetes bacterium]|nr:hypothetical protein [Planctomycetota bacterium]
MTGHTIFPGQSDRLGSIRGHCSLQISAPVLGQVILPGQSALPPLAKASW